MNAFFLEFFELVFRHIANLSAAVLSLFFDDLLCAEILGFNSENLAFNLRTRSFVTRTTGFSPSAFFRPSSSSNTTNGNITLFSSKH